MKNRKNISNLVLVFLSLAVSGISACHTQSKTESKSSPNTEVESQSSGSIPSNTTRASTDSSSNPASNTQPFLPMSHYTIENSELRSLRYWSNNRPNDTGHPEISTHFIEQILPVAASPEHGSHPFAVPGHTRQYISLDDGQKVISMNFKLSSGATFMKPNVDTMLTCLGLKILLQENNLNFQNAIDVGAGSGFISKYLAETALQSQVTAVDIDPQAGVFMNSAGAGMPSNVKVVIEDAIAHLSKNKHYDLVVSNPPYVPTLQETQSADPIAVTNPSFWEGTGLMSYLLEQTLPSMPQNGHIVMVVPSTALKSLRLVQTIAGLQAKGFQARVLHQQEVAYKAWFAGNNQVTHLLATPSEMQQPTTIGTHLSLFVGITPPKHPRNCQVDDGRRDYKGYYWQMVYILDFSRI